CSRLQRFDRLGRVGARDSFLAVVITRRRSRRSNPEPRGSSPGLLRSLWSLAMTGGGTSGASSRTVPPRSATAQRGSRLAMASRVSTVSKPPGATPRPPPPAQPADQRQRPDGEDEDAEACG